MESVQARILTRVTVLFKKMLKSLTFTTLCSVNSFWYVIKTNNPMRVIWAAVSGLKATKFTITHLNVSLQHAVTGVCYKTCYFKEPKWPTARKAFSNRLKFWNCNLHTVLFFCCYFFFILPHLTIFTRTFALFSRNKILQIKRKKKGREVSKRLPSYFYTRSNTALIVNTVEIVHASGRQFPDCGHHKPRTKKQGRWETKSVGRYIHGSLLPTVVWCTHISFTSPALLASSHGFGLCWLGGRPLL